MALRHSAHLVTRSPDQTRTLGKRIGSALQPGDTVALIGDLGAGKTVLAKGVLSGLGGDADEVTSPTFVLMARHEARLTLYHFDAYRLSGPNEMLAIGADDFFYGNGACIVEWADRVAAALPADRLEIHMSIAGESERAICFIPTGPCSEALAARIASGGRTG